MIKICIADNHPVVIHGIKSFFEANSNIEIVATANNLADLANNLQNKSVDIVLLDIELGGVSSIKNIKDLIKQFPTSKFVLFTSVSEKMYAPTAIKAGISGYLLKTVPLKELENAIIKVYQGIIIYSDDVRKSIDLLSKGKKDRLYKKLSTREVEVLRYLNEGKKNKEVAEILNLDEKTISTYKLRLLAKLSVTNLVDLLNKAKSLDII